MLIKGAKDCLIHIKIVHLANRGLVTHECVSALEDVVCQMWTILFMYHIVLMLIRILISLVSVHTKYQLNQLLFVAVANFQG